MTAKIIDGKVIAQDVKNKLKPKVSEFKSRFNRDITLAVVLVGEDPASQVYVRNKIKACEEVGIKSFTFYLSENSTEQEVIDVVNGLASDNGVDGILVQLPLPKHINENNVLSAIPTNKDVDGFSLENVGNLMLGIPTTIACTPFGVTKILESIGIDFTGKNAVVIGRSNIVGKPMAMLLLQMNCTVTICHSKTVNLKEICRSADVIIVAIGKPKFVTADMVKDGAVVVDVGINRTENGLCGDVDFESVSKVASYITPVPGGVGPMTIAMLLENTYTCACLNLRCKNDNLL